MSFGNKTSAFYACTNSFQFAKDVPDRKVTVTRFFNASPEDVWPAWTKSEYLFERRKAPADFADFISFVKENASFVI